MVQLVLASGSGVRARMLRQAGLEFVIAPVRVDETAIRDALIAEAAPPRDIADALAETKALRASARHPGALVIGADQILDCDGSIFAKPETPEDAIGQIRRLSGRTHRLHSAAVVCRDGQSLWRHVGQAELTMADLGETYVADYVARNWTSIRDSVGGYKIEEEGVRLMSRIEGDCFTILGLPLIALLTWLRTRGDIAS
jgi:septum formation protein